MGETGILHEDEHVELIEGEILQMAAKGSKHAGSLSWITVWFSSRLAGKAIVRVQDPVRLETHSTPEPDFVLARPHPDFYRSAHPGPADVLLLIEVADTALPYDRSVKQRLYALAGIPEFWIVDLTHEQVRVHREPQGERYASVRADKRGSEVAPLAFPDLSVPLDGILG
jgi:Uma2 family endonuclease